MAVEMIYYSNRFKRRKPNHATSYTTTAIAAASSAPDWAKLHDDLLDYILKMLPSVDVLRFRGVCSSWRSIAKAHIASLSNRPLLQSPLLLIPSDVDDQEDDQEKVAAASDSDFLLLNTADNEVQQYQFNNLLGKKKGFCCLGSSHGWVFFVTTDEAAVFITFHPFLNVQVHLPSLLEFNCSTNIQDHWIKKVVFSADPISSANNFAIVFMFGISNICAKIAYSKCGDTKWMLLRGTADGRSYRDIWGRDSNQVYALTSYGSVEIWDFAGLVPVKKLDIEPSFHSKIYESLSDYYTDKDYIVESSGDVLLVKRCIANFVDSEGNLVREDDLIDRDNNCPYWTKMFHIFKLDLRANQWVKVEDLDDKVLFLGGSESVLLRAQEIQGCQPNSIHFTDDYWERMDEHDQYGGHDMGVFHPKNSSVDNMFPNEVLRTQTSTFWVII